MTINKTLITLTHLYASEGNISFALTDGNTTLRGNTSSKKNLSLDIAYLAWELTNGEHAAKDLLAANPRENMKRYFRFAIDKEVVDGLALHYKQNGEDLVIKVAEDIINLFDSVNGNNAVSQAMGIANLVRGIQDGDFDLSDNQSEMNWVDKLTSHIFDTDALDQEQQGLSFIQTTLKDDIKIDLNTVTAVGNVFVSGSIGKINIRIFKSNVIQLFVTEGVDFTRLPTKIFSVTDKESFVTTMRRLISTQLS